MATTTFTSNYQIKLIGTGLEAGTWGKSTNENLKRIEQALGGSIEIDVVTYDPANYTSNTLTWITTDSADAGAVGSQGRNRVINFTTDSDPGADQTVEIRGSFSDEIPSRVYFVTNSVTGGHSVVLDAGGGTDYTLLNGSSAVIYTDVDGTAVNNLLSTLQIENLVFPAAADITIKENQASALEIKDSASTLVDITTTSSVVSGTISGISQAAEAVVTVTNTFSNGDRVQLTGIVGMTELNNRFFTVVSASGSVFTLSGEDSTGHTAFVASGTPIATKILRAIDLSAGDVDVDASLVDVSTQATAIYTKDSETASLDIRSGTGNANSYLTLDTSNKKVVIGKETSDVETLDIDTDDISVATQPTSILIKDDEAAALDIKESSNSYIKLNTVAGSDAETPSINFGESIIVPTAKVISLPKEADSITDSLDIGGESQDKLNVFAHAARHAVGGVDPLGGLIIQSVEWDWNATNLGNVSTNNVVSHTFDFSSRASVNSNVLVVMGCTQHNHAGNNIPICHRRYDIMLDDSVIDISNGSRKDYRMQTGEDSNDNDIAPIIMYVVECGFTSTEKISLTITFISGTATDSTFDHYGLFVDLGPVS